MFRFDAAPHLQEWGKCRSAEIPALQTFPSSRFTKVGIFFNACKHRWAGQPSTDVNSNTQYGPWTELGAVLPPKAPLVQRQASRVSPRPTRYRKGPLSTFHGVKNIHTVHHAVSTVAVKQNSHGIQPIHQDSLPPPRQVTFCCKQVPRVRVPQPVLLHGELQHQIPRFHGGPRKNEDFELGEAHTEKLLGPKVTQFFASPRAATLQVSLRLSTRKTPTLDANNAKK